MTEDMFRLVLEAANAKADKDGWSVIADGRLMTLHAGHDGVPMTIGKIDALKTSGGVVRAKNTKGELFIVALEDVFASALDVGSATLTARKAGFDSSR